MRRAITLAIAIGLSATRLTAQDIPLSKVLVEKETWRQVAEKVPPVTFLQGRPDGTIVILHGHMHTRINAKGEYHRGGNFPVYIFFTTRETFSKAGRKYAIDGENKSVECIHADKLVDSLKLPGLNAPACLTLWPDEGHLVIGEKDAAYLWAVRIEKDGSFGPSDRYYSLRTRPNEKIHVNAMTMDAGYLLYACTPLGVQVFDPTGRLSGVIPSPSKETMTAIAIGGAKGDELFIAAGDKIFARRIQGKASYTLKKEKK